jgi:nitrous oxide reductase accessory protein NosL
MRSQARAVITALVVFSFLGIASSEEFIEPTKEDKCAVCGMFPYKYPNWIAEIIFKDGTYVVFDGPKDMFKYYFNTSKYSKGKKSREDISDIHVTEYYTTRHMRAQNSFFVTGSDVNGPMGEELVPVKGRKEAESFKDDHKGKKILAFDEVTAEYVPGY